MIHLDLTGSEIGTLVSVLESDIADLSCEIANTDRLDYRERLRRRRDMLRQVLLSLTETRLLA